MRKDASSKALACPCPKDRSDSLKRVTAKRSTSRSVRRLAWASRMLMGGLRSRQQAFEGAAVDVLQRLEVGDGDVLVDLVYRGVRRAELHDLRADGGEEAPVRRAAGRRQ